MTTHNATSAPVFATGTEALKTFGIPQSDLRKATGLSLSAINRICVHGKWPAFGAGPALDQIDAYLVRRGRAIASKRFQIQSVKNHPWVAQGWRKISTLGKRRR